MSFKSFIGALCAVVLFSLPARAVVMTLGAKAPPLVAKSVGGAKVDLAKLKGKTVILYLWTTQCASCMKDLYTLRDFYNKYQDKGLAVIALSADPPQLRYMVENVDALVDYPVVMASDAQQNGYAMPGRFPLMYIITKDGKLHSFYSVMPKGQALLQAVFH